MIRPATVTVGTTTYDVPGTCDCEAARAEARREEEAERLRAEREAAERREQLYRRAGVKPRFMRAEPDATYLPAIEAGSGVYFVGDTSSGKTHAASALVKAYVDAHSRETYGSLMMSRYVRIVTVPDLLSELRGTYDGRGDETEVVHRYSGADLLVLDDLGKGAQTPWSTGMLFQIVNLRYEQGLPTVVTTQYEAPDLGRRLAEAGDRETARAIVRRLTCDGAVLVRLTGRR